MRVAVVSTASACGKTTLGKALATRLDAPFVELDALVHGPGWTETPDDVLRARLAPILAGERWVVDGNYQGKIGDLVVSQADLVVWLDLPRRVWIPRLVRRSVRRLLLREALWNGNRESFRGVFLARDSLLVYALRTARSRRETWPERLAPYPVVRLTSPAEVRAFFRDFQGSPSQ